MVASGEFPSKFLLKCTLYRTLDEPIRIEKVLKSEVNLSAYRRVLSVCSQHVRHGDIIAICHVSTQSVNHRHQLHLWIWTEVTKHGFTLLFSVVW